VAEKAACLDILAQLHKSGALREAYAKPSAVEITTPDSKSFGDGVSVQKAKATEPPEVSSPEGAFAMDNKARHDVFDYAARFLCVPTFRYFTKASSGEIDRDPYEATIELEERGIKAKASGRSARDAEAAAAINFFELADRHENNSRAIKDNSALSSGNAKLFCQWFQIVYPDNNFRVVGPNLTTGIVGPAWKVQMLLNDEAIGDAVEIRGEAGKEEQVEDLAYLTAAIALQKTDASLLPEFVKDLPNLMKGKLRSLTSSPVSLEIDSDSATLMEQTIDLASLPNTTESIELNVYGQDGRPKTRRHSLQSPFGNLVLQRQQEALDRDTHHDRLRKKKAELPMNRHRHEVLSQVEKNIYSIILGDTGSGKTTQVPQILLEDAIMNNSGTACNIICTQPRRIAATSVARRVAIERGERLGKNVGYQVRLDSMLPRQAGSITYCTTGILLMRLQHALNDVLDSYSHLVIDEVHERDNDLDFLLLVLRKAIQERLLAGKTVPKVVLMSATMEVELFAKYFDRSLPSGEIVKCPTLEIPGRLYPVTEKYLEEVCEILQDQYPGQLNFLKEEIDTEAYIEQEQRFAASEPIRARYPTLAHNSATATKGNEAFPMVLEAQPAQLYDSDDPSTELMEALVPIAFASAIVAHLARTTNHGAILVFLPGLKEILDVDRCLRSSRPFGVDFRDLSRFKICLLHSTISSAGQSEVFDPVPEGCRKIILATNIAETSVTIPEVRYVVDSGKIREKHYDPVGRITKLKCTWISKSNSKQRAGRAGRVQDGYYYALFSKARLDSMRSSALPEILRSDLQEVCVDIKAQDFNMPIRNFLAAAIEPPSPQAVAYALQNLQELEVLTEDEVLTPLGRILASL
jgi:ATP-dependent RNA helicase DHX36